MKLNPRYWAIFYEKFKKIILLKNTERISIRKLYRWAWRENKFVNNQSGINLGFELHQDM